MKTNDFDKLRDQLNNTMTWPSVYLFKFIAPADNRIYAMIHDLFPLPAEMTTRNSAGGKYMSITVKELMLNANEVIDRYQKVSAIEGVRAL